MPTPPMPSLELLLALVQGERDKQLQHFDGLDTKAGVLLGFNGVLIAVAGGIHVYARVAGILLAALSGAFALAALRPRDFPILDVDELRRYLRAEELLTKGVVFDTLRTMVKETGAVLETKATNLKISLLLLVAAAVAFGVGVAVGPGGANV